MFGFSPRFPEALCEQQGGLRPRRGEGGVVLGETELEDGDRLRAETSVPARWGSLQYSKVLKIGQCQAALLQGDRSGRSKPPIDLDLGCSTMLPGQWVAAVAAHQLPELLELSQREVFTVLTCHPVEC